MNVAVQTKPARSKKSTLATQTKIKPDAKPIWDPARGPDRSTLRIAPVVEHKRLTSPTDYAPARDVALPPEEESKKTSGRSTCYYLDPTDGLIKVAEGQLELNSTIRFLSDRRVRRFEPQFGPVHYMSAKGRKTHTVFDHRVHYIDDTKTVVSVKPRARAAKLKTNELNRAIFDQMPASEADRVQLITQDDLPQWAIANYRLFHSVRNEQSHLFASEMRAAAKNLRQPQSIDSFARPWGGAKAVFRTVAFLIFEGHLKADPPCEITETTLVVSVK